MILNGEVFISAPIRAKEIVQTLKAEERLLVAMLARAIADASGNYERGISDGERVRDNEKRSAMMWITSHRRDAYSFVWLCEQLGYEPVALRKRIMAILKNGYQIVFKTKGGKDENIFDSIQR